jgi:hypothetical protein
MLRAVVVLAQGTIERRTLIQAQGLGAGCGLHSSLRKRRTEARLSVGGLEIVPQCLALLAKGKLEEVDEAVFKSNGI